MTMPEHRRCVPWSCLLLTAIAFTALTAAASEPKDIGANPKQSRIAKVEAKLVWNLRGHTRWVRSLAITPKGDSLISSGDDGKVLLWKLDDANQSDAKPKLLRRHQSPVTAIAISPNGKQLAVGTWDGLLESCNTNDGRTAGKLDGHRETVTSLDFHPSGKYLSSGSADDTLVLWDAATGEELLSFHQGNEYDVTTVAFDPTGKRVVTGDGENQLKVWDTETGAEVRTLKGHTETVTCAEYGPNGKTIVSGGWDDALQLWNAESGKRIKELRGHNNDITSVMFADRDLIVSASEDRTVRIWSARTGTTLLTLKLSSTTYALAYNSNRHLLAVGGQKDCKVFRLTIDRRSTSRN